MPVSYTPMSGADLPLTLSSFNTRFQSIEDYFLALVAAGGGQRTFDAEAGEGLGDRAPGYLDLSDGKIYQMDADAAGPKAGAIRGFINGATLTGNTATLVISGEMDGFTGLTALSLVYVGTTAGTITQTRPSPSLSGSQVMIAPMGLAIATDTVIVAPNKIQYQKREAFADNDTLTVQHHPDASGYTRDVWAYVTENEASAEAEGYSSSNQDSDVNLRENLAGGTSDNSGAAASSAAVGDFSGTPYRFAQNFDADAGQLTEITIELTANTGTPTGTLTWEIRANDNSGDPGTLLQTGTFSPTASATNTIPVSDGIILDADVYFLVIRATTTQTTNNRWNWNRTGDTLAGKARFFSTDGGSTWSSAAEDLIFSVTTDATTKDKLSQTFALAGSTDIASVGLWLKKVGSPTGTATVRIETVSGGEPTGTLADPSATVTFLESSLASSYAEKLVTFSSEFTLGAGDYAIVLSTTRSAHASNYIVWGADGSSPSYGDGEMFYEESSSWNAESKDAVFSVYEPSLSHPSKVGVDWWSSSYADVVNRYGDGSGADLSTQTTFKCLRDAGFSDLTVVVEIP